MKVIFLDIDGVLNSEKFFGVESQPFRYQKALSEKKSEDEISVIINIDPNAVAWVNYIVSKTGAEVVISSTWRSDYNIPFKMRYAGLLKPIYGITPFSKDRHRGTEIQEWLNDHSEVTHYVILDDDNDMLEEQLNNFVQTDWLEGLNEECADKAVEILNKEL